MINEFIFNELEYNLPDYPYTILIGQIHDDFMIHTHDYSELFVILNGEATHMVDDEKYRVSAGDVYVIREQTSHGFTNVKNLLICNIGIKDPSFTEKYSDLKILPGYQALFILEPFYRREHQFRSSLHLDYTSLQYVISIINHMNQEYSKREDGFRSMFQSDLLHLVIYLSRIYPKMSGQFNSRVLTIANAVIDMESFFDKKIRIEELARKSGMSPRNFNRVFKSYYGISPVEYLINLRINKAESLLGDTDMSITDISIESGFCDSTHFARQFRSKLGITPTAYRKNKKKK